MSKPVAGRLAIALIALLAACGEKKPSADTGALPANHGGGDPAAQPMTTNDPVDTTPLPNVDVSKLDADHQKLFYKMVSTLSSPCGKAH